jgi:RNA polymerase sigma-70 factor, ECF subfamily
MHNLKVVESNRRVYSEKSDTQNKNNMNFPPKNPEREIDQKLVEKAQKGDKQAFGILVEKYHKKLYRLLSRMVRDQSEIEDIVQDSFIKGIPCDK